MKPGNGLNFISLWFSIIMVLLVIAGALAFIFTDLMEDRLYGSKRTILTVVFIAYAIYRSIRIYQVLKGNNSYDEN